MHGPWRSGRWSRSYATISGLVPATLSAWTVAGWWTVEYACGMSTLAEIEAAADALPSSEKQELLLFLAARLRAEGGALPVARRFTREQVDGWIAEDEAEILVGE